MAEINFKELSFAVVGAAMEVHRELGPGYLENVYRNAMAHELSLRGIAFEAHKALPVCYMGALVGEYQADIVVEQSIIFELKSTSALAAAHIAQAHHYLTATGQKLAILLNFGTSSLQSKRIVK